MVRTLQDCEVHMSAAVHFGIDGTMCAVTVYMPKIVSRLWFHSTMNASLLAVL